MIINLRLAYLVHEDGQGWARIGRGNGWGLTWTHRRHAPLFSERNGYCKRWPAWPAAWRFGVLRPSAPPVADDAGGVTP